MCVFIAWVYLDDPEFGADEDLKLRHPVDQTLTLQTPEKLRRFLQNIDSSAARLTRLLNDLLDLAKIESGKVELLPQDVALDALLDSLDKGFRAVAGLMKVDLQQLDEKTLDHIARRMEDIRRRLDLGHLGTQIRQHERGVRSGQHGADLEDLDPLQRRTHLICAASSPITSRVRYLEATSSSRVSPIGSSRTERSVTPASA